MTTPAPLRDVRPQPSAPDEAFEAVESPAAERARVCSYDRSGNGTSDEPATMPTFQTQAADLLDESR